MRIITLTTDFGLKDGNVGVMKGVILGINPDVQIVDISHNISPQNIFEASLILRRSAVYFPPGTTHIVVVDPGVGTTRRPIVARIGPYYFIGPDNGVVSMLLEEGNHRDWEIVFVEADKPGFWLADVSNVFHGRDIFAPLGAHLSKGVPLEALGTIITDPILKNLPQPHQIGYTWIGEVIHIDHFGNLSTNIRFEHLGKPLQIKVHIQEDVIDGLVNTFGDRPIGSLIALYGSTGNLIISEVNGSAESRLKAHIGDIVSVEFSHEC